MEGDATLERAIAALETLRRAQGVSQGALGLRLGRTQSTVAHALGQRRTRTKLSTLARIAGALDAELIVEVRPRRPIAPAADLSRECFACPCGFQAFGPAGELGFAEWSRERQRWVILVPVGPSAYQLQVEQHITGWRERGIAPCPQASARCAVAYG